MLPPPTFKQPSQESKENIVIQRTAQILKDQQSTNNLMVNRGDVSMHDASSNSGEFDDSSIASELKTPQPGVPAS